MSVSAAESLAYFNYIQGLNADSSIEAQRREFRERSRREGKFVVHGCIDARNYPASTFDPGKGPVLIQTQSFGGTAMPERFAALSMGLVRGVHGHIFVSHWAGNSPDHVMGFDGCGARHASEKMRRGVSVAISGAPFINEHVEPHCIEGALKSALNTSVESGVPAVAIGLDHLTQLPHLLGVAEAGQWRHVVPSSSVHNGVPEIDPDEIREKYPQIARIVERGRVFSRTQTHEEIEGRRQQNPMAVWVSGSFYPTWEVWGTIPLGQIMRITYARHSAKDQYVPRKNEINMINAHSDPRRN
jgi:hypothetical protein